MGHLQTTCNILKPALLFICGKLSWERVPAHLICNFLGKSVVGCFCGLSSIMITCKSNVPELQWQRQATGKPTVSKHWELKQPNKGLNDQKEAFNSIIVELWMCVGLASKWLKQMLCKSQGFGVHPLLMYITMKNTQANPFSMDHFPRRKLFRCSAYPIPVWLKYLVINRFVHL